MNSTSFPAYVQVVNTAIHQQVRFEEMRFRSIEEAKEYKQKLEEEYGAIGCHRVSLFIEMFPEMGGDEFDEDELESVIEEEVAEEE